LTELNTGGVIVLTSDQFTPEIEGSGTACATVTVVANDNNGTQITMEFLDENDALIGIGTTETATGNNHYMSITNVARFYTLANTSETIKVRLILNAVHDLDFVRGSLVVTYNLNPPAPPPPPP